MGGSPAVSAPDPAGFKRSDLVDILAPDDIRPVVSPTFESIDRAASWLPHGSPVIVVPTRSGARAYPLAIMLAHEVVDDVVDGKGIAVSYSPLTNAAVVFDRTIRGQTLEFGTAGKVFQSNLVLYDHQTKSLWWQLGGVSVAGAFKGAPLQVVPSEMAAFEDFMARFPRGQVLARPTTAAYQFTPYPSYDSRTRPYPGFFRGKLDPRMRAMQRVIGVVAGGVARAYPYDELARHDVVQEGDNVVIWGGAARSPLDTPSIGDGAVVGSGEVFSTIVGGKSLHLASEGGSIKDAETGSIWSVLGSATSGPLKGTQLEIIPHVDAFWFSWTSWQPATTIWQP